MALRVIQDRSYSASDAYDSDSFYDSDLTYDGYYTSQIIDKQTGVLTSITKADYLARLVIKDLSETADGLEVYEGFLAENGYGLLTEDGKLLIIDI